MKRQGLGVEGGKHIKMEKSDGRQLGMSSVLQGYGQGLERKVEMRLREPWPWASVEGSRLSNWYSNGRPSGVSEASAGPTAKIGHAHDKEISAFEHRVVVFLRSLSGGGSIVVDPGPVATSEHREVDDGLDELGVTALDARDGKKVVLSYQIIGDSVPIQTLASIRLS